MAKIIRKQKRKRMTLIGFASMCFACSFIIYFMTAIFLRTANNGVMRSINDTQQEIAVIENDNETLNRHIAELSNINRVSKLAGEAGLENSKNMMIVKPGE